MSVKNKLTNRICILIAFVECFKFKSFKYILVGCKSIVTSSNLVAIIYAIYAIIKFVVVFCRMYISVYYIAASTVFILINKVLS